ncbi:hypothetical protein R1flu_009614 [Riccia fluitans]|uniref:FGFR1 oncogene partner (FOP) N-terminal dimerisation domain-containing protein n=1 Tax=Riccia fluitans TaxID=41844 RepID=A0ABD1Z2L3_9MARC
MDSDLDVDASLATALKEKLERRGVLGGIKAKIRSELYGVIDHSEESGRREVSDQDYLIDDLVRDYLLYRRLNITLSVFTPESGQLETPLDRSMLAKKLGIANTGAAFRKLPLLYTLISEVHPKGREFFDIKQQGNVE